MVHRVQAAGFGEDLTEMDAAEGDVGVLRIGREINAHGSILSAGGAIGLVQEALLTGADLHRPLHASLSRWHNA